jgi:erythronate-4-phosphate dehydrogenase
MALLLSGNVCNIAGLRSVDMMIAVDDAIPFWQETFPLLGEVRPFSGRDVTRRDIQNADALIVRSVTAVNEDLLEGTSVRFVATATVGTDHLDLTYLESRGIYVASATGSSANAVSEYIIAALMAVAGKRGWDLARMSLGIIGVGNIGRKVNHKAKALGMTVLLCDPPLKDLTGDSKYLPLDEVLEADILTFHVPLTIDGAYPTWHMINQKTLMRLTPRQFLINSSRGDVFSQDDLRTALVRGDIAGVALDVWHGEPNVDYDLMDRLDIGTAHIAGYSLDARIRATEMIFEQLCSFCGVSHPWENRCHYPGTRHIAVDRVCRGQEALRTAVLEAYDILADDQKLRTVRNLPEAEAARGFDRLRAEYELRPEFPHFAVRLTSEHRAEAAVLMGLGFQVQVSEAKNGAQ